MRLINSDFNDMFIKYMTALLCWKFINKDYNVDLFEKSYLIDRVKSKLSDKFKKISEYQKTYIIGGRYQSFKHGEKLLELAKDDNLFNAEIYDLIQELEAFLKEHAYVNTIASSLRTGESHRQNGLLDCLAQLFKCNGVAINNHYQFLKHKQEQEQENN